MNVHSISPYTLSQLVSLDFDGVVCDSVGESSLSAIKVKQGIDHRVSAVLH